MEQKRLRIEPAQTPETQVHSFIEAINAENEAGLPPAADRVSGEADPIGFLIDRVDSVVLEAAQMGTEPLSTKAGCLAALYQAQALRDIAFSMGRIETDLQKITSLLESVLESDVGGFGYLDQRAIRTRPV